MSTDPDATGAAALDDEGFALLVAAETAPLFRFAMSLVRSPSEAEDLVQETFVRAYERRGQFRGEAAVGTWLHRILHNLAVDRARRRSREVLVDEVVEQQWREDAYTVDADLVVERAGVREEVEDALLRVPFHYRTVVVLHDAEGWNAETIAQTLDISLPATKQRLRRGRMLLVTAIAQGAERREALDGVPLRCWDARALVSDYIDGDLPPDAASRVEGHLKGCPTCPPLYASLVGTHETLGRMRDPDTVIDPAVAERVAHRVRR